MNNLKNHLRSLVQLAIADQSFDSREKRYIYGIGKANGLPEKEIDETVVKVMSDKSDSGVDFSALSYDEKFDYIYNIVQLMKIDSKVFLSEIRYCESIAKKLGFKDKVVKTLSAKVFSDPDITADINALKKVIKKFEL